MSIACAMIVRDGADSIERCVASVRHHVAEVCIYLAGDSKDRTVKILDRIAREPGAPLRVVQGEWRDDFAWARERSFELVSPQHKWILWLDADDELHGGENLPGCVHVGETRRLPYVMVLHGYEWLDGQRRYLPRARIVHRDRARWEGIVHEDARALEGAVVYTAHAPQEIIRVDHQRDTVKKPGHYLPLIERATQDVEHNPRAYYFLARELAALDRWDEALRPLLRYVSERHDEIEGDPNQWRLLALEFGIEIAQHVEDDAVADWLSYEHHVYADRFASFKAGIESPPGRNKLCPCGNGKKFKKCHGA